MEKLKTIINHRAALVNSKLQGWTIYPRQSSLVAYIAVNPENDTLFIQFNNGTCFLYKDVPVDLIKQATTTVNIVNFYTHYIKGVYQPEAIESHCIDSGVEV